MLTTRETAAPFARCVPAATPCEMTRPWRTVDEKRLVIAPVLQCAACRLAAAAATVLPFTAGTTQTGGLNGATPLLTTSETAAPFARCVPAATPCEMTRPFRTFDE